MKDVAVGVVPLKISFPFLSVMAEYQVRLSYKGYDEKVIPVTFKLNGWHFGNIVFGGLIGMLIVDPASGAMWRIEKQTQDIFETLTQSMSSVTEPSLKIMDINDIPETMKKSLVRIK